MTKRLVNKLLADGYKIVIRTGEQEIGVAKTFDLTDDTDFDMFELYSNETCKDLEMGQEYRLEDLA